MPEVAQQGAQPTQAQKRALDLLDSLWNDKELGAAIQKKAKEKWPEVKTTSEELDPIVSPLKAQLDDLSAQLKQEREDRAAEKKQAKEDQDKRSLEQKLDEARAKFSLTDEGFDKMVARMKETGNYYDAEAAASWVAAQTPPAPPPGPTWMPQDMNLWGSKERDEKQEKLWKNPERFFDSEVSEMLRDPDRYVREAFAA